MTEKIAALVNTNLEESTATDDKGKTTSETNEDEEIGPKTAAMPDPTVYPAHNLRDLIDIGTIPEHLQEEAWNILEKHGKAFGFDGRLGNVKTKAKIRLKEGTEPISVPMYTTSPAKREVIDKQLDVWIQQRVIEPSKSPWSAPVVIAYRNGKPRF
ncbi:hypothetical protein BDZ89DRAFT_974142, partial [Hymenopellis radicata]